MNQAPAVHINPTHQAVETTQTRGWWKDYDAELDLETSFQQEQEMKSLRRLDKSPQETVEMAQEQYELACYAARAQRWQGQERWQGKENEEMRRGVVMHPYTFMKKLAAAGVNAQIDAPQTQTLWIEKEDAEGIMRLVPIHTPTISSAKVWLNGDVRQGLIGVNAWVKDEESGYLQQKTVTTIQYPYAQEYSVMRFDRHNVPKKEKYKGWRTTLLVLIYADVITEEEAHRAFGEPIENEASAFYRQQLQWKRAIRAGLQL